MSKASVGDKGTPEGIEQIADHREELEELAASELPCAEIAAALLEIREDHAA